MCIRKKIKSYELFVFIAVCMVLLELVVWLFAPYLSRNIAHIDKIPDIAQEVASENKGGNKTVLFLGNSLIDHAVNLELLGAENSQGKLSGVPVFKVIPDGTSLWDWYCIVKNEFSDRASSPRTIVIGYAWAEVPPVPSRLAGFFCDITDLPDLYELGMSRSSDVLEYLVASVSRLYAVRETIRKRILDLIIPDYRESVRKVNAVNNKRNVDSPIDSLPQQTGKLMDRFQDLLDARDIRLVFIAMPVKKDYPLNEGLVRTIHERGGVFYDYRQLDGITDSMFLDAIHLNDRGSLVFTRRLASDLSRNIGR